MRTGNNQPYVKQFNSMGLITNSITPHNPFISFDNNRRDRRAYIQKISSTKRNTPNKRQQQIVIKIEHSFTRIVLKAKQIVTFITKKIKIIHHERKG